MVGNLVEKLYEAHVVIKALICDQSSSNSKLFKLLGITATKPYFNEENNQKIYGIFDPPHLLKTLRRNLMKNDMVHPKGIVSFKHIRDFYNIDRTLQRHLAPKLTDKHVYADGLNSMNVSFFFNCKNLTCVQNLVYKSFFFFFFPHRN